MTMGRIFRNGPGLLPAYFLCVVLLYPVSGQEQPNPEPRIEVPETELGRDVNLTCRTISEGVKVEWLFQDKPIVKSERIKINTTTKRNENAINGWIESILSISKTTRTDSGNYTCVASYYGGNATDVRSLDLRYPASFVNSTKIPDSVVATWNNSRNNVTMECVFDMYYDPDYIEWVHPNTTEPEPSIKRNVTRINDRLVKSTHSITAVTFKENGIHSCVAFDKVTSNNVTGNINLVVYGDPTVELVSVIGISRSQIYVNWTVNPANSKITSYYLLYRSPREGFLIGPKIDPNATSAVLVNLTPNTTYDIKLEVQTEHSTNKNKPSMGKATTLVEDPVFVPNISINGFSATSVTIGWQAPSKEIEKYIHYYLLEARRKDGGTPRKAYHSRDYRNLPYMFDNLQPHSTYIFKVRACQDFTKECGNWSEEMEAATLDGVPGRPSDVRVNCSANYMVLTWGAPKEPNAEIKGYTMELTGTAEYRDRNGQLKKETWGPLSRFNSNDSSSARFDDLQPNTVYTVRVSAMTRTRRRGEEEVRNCSTARAPPDHPPRASWRKVLDRDRYLFKMHLPKVSERNGPICCYRVYMVRLANSDMRSLGTQPSLEVVQYEEAHGVTPRPGAYIADVFSNDNFPAESHLVLGDDHSIFNRSDVGLNQPGCERCLRRPERPVTIAPLPKVTTTITTTTEEDLPEDVTTDPVDVKGKEKRSIDDDKDYSNMSMMKDSTPQAKVEEDRESVIVKDGPLDPTVNYTVFIELIPAAVDGTLPEPMYSEYLNALMPAPSPVAPVPSTALEIALQATCAIAALVLIIMIIFCIMQTRRSRKLPPHPPLEMSRLPPVFRFLWPTLSGRGQPSVVPPDMAPIAKEDLPAAYAERHADSDYGFQKEFELLQMLSESFTDRTTHASEARENQSKNRYPDIKAYDQTRVKLSQIDSITGSDYINANYVMGYKERKKFICAQGPTDTTVNDFWRMVWEQGLELIVMLTNLEEYSKVKCSKYWPDEVRGSKAFGGITVQHVSEKRYSDYIVRELKIMKQPVNAEGQPIVENNGIAKRNGDITKQESSESAPTSPREAKTSAESRTVKQYHFLMWKDFNAPEHPYSILKFIKRVNEAWANMVGRPVVVHCSAGVGRTGTLVALDCLLEQLRAAGQVSVFNTVAELRRQRNFLVQSQKQYVFVYRTLVEYAHYGDTEITASRLKSAIDRLRNTPEGADKCLMEHEFEKMIDPPMVEIVKSCAAGEPEEVRARNRSMDYLPYDTNRVILSPIPGREYSTYINASFVEAYDNSEGFIITQDPLPGTIFDFWRMVADQGVSTIVMLSELGEGKCPRYWDDGTATYEHMSVLYEDSESCPYYTRRQFRVTNNKTGHTQSVRQLQYQGWPTAPGHVPEVTRGLAELADAVNAVGEGQGPMVVHCNFGTERSALFVALCILITQLRTEKRVDVNAVARKVRAQRAGTIDTFLQYEFLHRAILNYAELHSLLEDS